MENKDKTQTNSDKFRRLQALVGDHLNLNPQDEDATKIFTLWKRKLEIYLQIIDTAIIYTESITKLERVYRKTINKIYGRWNLAQEKQRESESRDAFVNPLMFLANDFSFADVTAIEYKKESVLQSFISGLEDPYIRQWI